MTSFKNGLRVHTTSSVINDALMTDFSSQNDPKIGPKSLPNWFQRASERGLNEDSDSKLKKQTARSIGPAMPEPRLASNWRVLGSVGEGNREGARHQYHHTPGNPWTSQGVGG